MKILKRITLVAAGVLLLGLAAVCFSLLRSVPPLSGRERVAGLGAGVEVVFDSLAIPHITASSDADAFTALGYLHARERLWAMEIMRRAAEGRLSEILGAATVASDRYLRSLDIVRASRSGLATVPPESRAILDAYVRGINAWIAAPTRPLPPEFRLLRFRPEPWTALQSFEVARVMAWDLQAGSTELRLARALAIVGPERIRDLFPPADSGPVIIQRGTGSWRGRTAPPRGGRSEERTRRTALPRAHLAAGEIPVVPPEAEAILDWVAMSRASNAWVIGGSRTASGKPILANDPHLELRAPALWYLASIASPGYAVAGATIPGMPGVILGRNRRIAWGWTNLGADDVDYVIERFTADTARVLTTAGWQPAEVERDSIRVRGRPAVPFVLRRTGHGPVVGASPEAPGAATTGEVRLLALRWNAHDPSDEVSAGLALDRAGDWETFLAAAHQLKAPEQNWVYADVDGNIGYTATGNVPVRSSGNGLLPTAGWTDEGRWERYLDFEELPRVFNPPEGFIVTANNRVIGPEYPFLLTADWELPHRAARIRELITGGTRFTADDVRRMQMDTLDVFARWAKERAARAAASAGRSDVAQALRAWDGTMGSDRTEPTIFYTWYRALQRLTFEDELQGTWAPGYVLQAGMRAGAGPWFDDVRTPEREDLDALSLRAMRAALPLAADRRWGTVHVTVSRHALGSAAPLDLVLRLNVGPAPRAGSLYTVDVADFGAFTPPFINTHAASFRQVVDLAVPQDGMLILSSGQSGNPLSRHYRDQVRRWWGGTLARVPLGRELGRGATVLMLVPGG